MSAEQNSSIQFVQSCPPPLDSGDYRIQIKQQIQSPEQITFTRDVCFSVQGPRFRLEPTDVYATYPPANHTGQFENCLPHIIFTRRTLPWEQSLDGKEVVRRNEKSVIPDTSPWLALIVLHGDDMSGGWSGESKPMKVKDLCNPPEGIFYPEFHLEKGQSADEPCKVLDLPLHLFQTIVPKESELAYLCHVRVVADGQQQGTSEDGKRWFATVVSNRFPVVSPEGTKNRVHLVSLEGFQDYLPGGGKKLKDFQTVRLVSLADWSFVGKEEPYSFQEIAQKLVVDRLHLPVRGQAETPAEQMVESMLEQGYTIHPHLFRHGEKTMSWYRGPLVPLHLPERDMEYIPYADGALQYDPNMGLFDVSYAAAWQVGRLLALQNWHFAKEMHHFRSENHQRIRSAQNEKQIHAKLAPCLSEDEVDANLRGITNEEDFYRVYLKFLASDFLDQLLGKNEEGEGLLGSLADTTGLRVHVEKHNGLLSHCSLESMGDTDEQKAGQLLDHQLQRKEE